METKIKTGNEIKNSLGQFIGTTQWFKHWTNLVTYTDGIKYLAEETKSYWLIDLVASYQIKQKIREIPFQLWTIEVNLKDNTGKVTMKEDSDQPIIISQKLPYTDFPIEELQFYVCDGVILLKTEY